MEHEIRRHLNAQSYKEAFELILERYQRKVFRLAYSMLGNEALAEDMAQEIFLRVWKALPAYRGQASLSTWIYTISRNTCLSRRKQAASNSRSLSEEGVRRAAELRNATRPSPGAQIDIATVLSGLPEKYRQVLALFYLEDKSYAEVSVMLDLPLGTVKTYLHRARKQLSAMSRESYGLLRV